MDVRGVGVVSDGGGGGSVVKCVCVRACAGARVCVKYHNTVCV